MPAETQKDFARALFDPARPALANVQNPHGEHAPKRFNVYRNNVIVSLTEAIEDGFPLCKRLVGEEFFKAMAREFVRNHPPRSPLMFNYGDEFPSFVEGFEPAQSVPYLVDMARVEYARRISYFAKDAEYLDPSTLANLDEEAQIGMRLEIHPSVSIIRSPYPLFDLYNHLNDGTSIGSKAQDVLTFRKGHEVISRLAPTGLSNLIENLTELPLGEAIAKTLEQNPHADLAQPISVAIEMSQANE